MDRVVKRRRPGVTARQPSTLERLLAAGDPFAVAAFVPVGSTLFRKTQRGQLYWTANRGGSRLSRYVHIGSHENKAALLACWRVVQAEIDELEKHPVGARLVELRKLTVQIAVRHPPAASTRAPRPPVALGAGAAPLEAMLAAGGTKR
jgi:hypothetical protein